MLVEHFPDIVDLEFTAKMEDDLDKVATGDNEWRPLIKNFYEPFHKNLMQKEKEVEKIITPDIPTDEVCENCKKPMVIKEGRFGKFMACTGFPDCKTTKTIKKGTGVSCPKCDKGEIIEKHSRKGKTFYACDQYPDCDQAYWSKPNGEKCPDCKQLLVLGAKDAVRCSNKECKYKKTAS
jgi:DNA topoisomerase-1